MIEKECSSRKMIEIDNLTRNKSSKGNKQAGNKAGFGVAGGEFVRANHSR